MNVVFIGASKFGRRCLEAIRDIPSVNVSGVVTAPEKFSISYNKDGVVNVLHSDITTFCNERDIPVAQISDGMKGDDLFNQVLLWKPDAFFVCGWYHMVPKRWREVAPVYGLHASLLPDYCGGAPLVWAIINGEKETGITLFQFDDGVDSGPIAGQGATPIYEDDTIATLYARIEDIGINLVREFLPALSSGDFVLRKQSEEGRRVFPQRKPEDGKIDWGNGAMQIHNFIRAQTKPYPGAFSTLGGAKISVWSSRPVSHGVYADPGHIIHDNGRVIVACGNNTFIEVLSIAVDGADLDAASIFDILASGKKFDA